MIPKPYDYPTYLKRRLRTLAPLFKDDAIFIEVDCSLHPEFCSKNAFAGIPSMDVFYLSKKEQRIKENPTPKRFRFDYLWSIYGITKFLEDYNFVERRNIFEGIFESFKEKQKKF